MNLLFTNLTAILPDRLVEGAWVCCENGRIVVDHHKTAQRSAGCGGRRWARRLPRAGFHRSPRPWRRRGDFMDGTPGAVRAACRAHARHGTTTIFPTTTTGSPEQILAMLDAIKAVRSERLVDNGARIAGVHLYGSVFCGRQGGLPCTGGTEVADRAEYRAYFATASCASPPAPRSCRVRCPSTARRENGAASSPAALERKLAGDEGGVPGRNAACRSLLVRDEQRGLGPLAARRADAREYARVCPRHRGHEHGGDRGWLPPRAGVAGVRVPVKGPRKLALVTDANRAMDLPPGNYRFGRRKTVHGSRATVAWAGLRGGQVSPAAS